MRTRHRSPIDPPPSAKPTLLWNPTECSRIPAIALSPGPAPKRGSRRGESVPRAAGNGSAGFLIGAFLDCIWPLLRVRRTMKVEIDSRWRSGSDEKTSRHAEHRPPGQTRPQDPRSERDAARRPGPLPHTSLRNTPGAPSPTVSARRFLSVSWRRTVAPSRSRIRHAHVADVAARSAANQSRPSVPVCHAAGRGAAVSSEGRHQPLGAGFASTSSRPSPKRPGGGHARA